MTVQAVLFDLDGTLIDSTDAIVDCFFHTFDELTLTRPPRDAIVSTISLTLENQFRTMTSHDPAECARIYRERYFRIGPEMTTLLPFAGEILSSCRASGAKLGFVTSKLRAASELLLRRLSVLDFFDVGIGPEDVEKPKPDPEPVRRALDHLNITAADAVYVGDTPLDVEAASAAGVRSIAVTTGYASERALNAAGPTVICANLEEVLVWLRGNGLASG